MDWARRAIFTAFLSCMPLVIGAVINLFIDFSALNASVMSVKDEFLRTVQRIDKRLDRIEDKLDN